MSYTLKEVQAIVAHLLAFGSIDKAIADIGKELTNRGVVHNDTGDNCRRILEEFARDNTIK